MADHIDKRVRDAVVALLTGLPTTGAHCFASRIYPLQDSELPGLRVFTDDSDITPLSMGGNARRVNRTINLKVEICGKAIANYDDSADASKNEIEKAIAGAQTLSSNVKWVQLQRIETERDGGGEQPVMVTRMIFECLAQTALNAPDVPL